MPPQPVDKAPIWKQLQKSAERMALSENHLSHLLQSEERLGAFSLKNAGLFYDFSRQRLDESALGQLYDLARERRLPEQFQAMMAGEKLNVTENRAALHTAARSFSKEPVVVDAEDVMPAIRDVRQAIRSFSERILSADLRGSTGKPFTDAVIIGIGGSYLGTEFVANALGALKKERGLRLHFLANVDIDNFGRIAAVIEPQQTLWVVISKSYTTAETTANARQAYLFMREKGLDPLKHTVTVTSKGSPGDDPSNPVLASFHMFDFIGGRYSVTSAVGGVPLSLLLGYDTFERFLKGAEELDQHARQTPPEQNIPLTAALISVWNNNFLKYATQAIIPYSTALSKLAPHVQQLNMESNGKGVTAQGVPLDIDSGVIIFGEPGTNAQHSFFQLAHQGRPFPIDFIGILNPGYRRYRSTSKGVSNHQELWANLISQPKALALGKTDSQGARHFPGNRPSSTLIMEDLSPENVGRLLAFYEARTVFEAFVWGTNPFDQFGVELGKSLADEIRHIIAAHNTGGTDDPAGIDPVSRYYLKMLFDGKL